MERQKIGARWRRFATIGAAPKPGEARKSGL
jgi:hypothetical protein